VDLEERKARMRVSNYAIKDHFTIGNSLGGDPITPLPATVSFTVHWSGGSGKKTIGDGTTFAASVIEDTASISWSGSEAGFSFSSTSSTSLFAEIGRERSGVFLNGESEGGDD
jgi:hypothetical protein